ncbi:hypothetical protein BJV78DRAFT_1194370 [Lactifluus subvellereus]|nr:hypothetical protein BJV78DRAFT_1194370 [Lactifluus subvellereus]
MPLPVGPALQYPCVRARLATPLSPPPRLELCIAGSPPGNLLKNTAARTDDICGWIRGPARTWAPSAPARGHEALPPEIPHPAALAQRFPPHDAALTIEGHKVLVARLFLFLLTGGPHAHSRCISFRAGASGVLPCSRNPSVSCQLAQYLSVPRIDLVVITFGHHADHSVTTPARGPEAHAG